MSIYFKQFGGAQKGKKKCEFPNNFQYLVLVKFIEINQGFLNWEFIHSYYQASTIKKISLSAVVSDRMTAISTNVIDSRNWICGEFLNDWWCGRMQMLFKWQQTGLIYQLNIHVCSTHLMYLFLRANPPPDWQTCIAAGICLSCLVNGYWHIHGLHWTKRDRTGSQNWGFTLIIPVLGRLRKNCHKFKGSLRYIVNFRPTWMT